MHRYSYKVLWLVLLVSLGSVLFSETTVDSSEQENQIVEKQVDTKLRNPEESIPLVELDVTKKGSETDSKIFTMIRLVLSLVFVCIVLYFVLRFLKKSSRFKLDSDPFLKNVASLSLAQGKTLYVVTLNSKGYLIGASESSLSLISEIEDKELVDAMNLHAEENSTDAPRDFSSILKTYFPSLKKDTPSIDETEDFLAQQRQRIKNRKIKKPSQFMNDAFSDKQGEDE